MYYTKFMAIFFFYKISNFFKISPWNFIFSCKFKLSPLCMNEEKWKKCWEIKLGLPVTLEQGVTPSNLLRISYWSKTNLEIYHFYRFYHYILAYRHVLLNGGYTPLIVRMALLTLICDGYIEWAYSTFPGEFFEQEYEFYLMCLKIVIGE